MKSKFKIISYFFFCFFLISTTFYIRILINFKSTFNSFYAGFFVVALMLLVLLVCICELRDKIIEIEFINNQLKIKRFFGIGVVYFFDDKFFDGFYNSTVITKYGSYNYHYLMKEGKKVAEISNQYHKNFDELSEEIKKRYKYLGYINSGFISEIKDIFN